MQRKNQSCLTLIFHLRSSSPELPFRLINLPYRLTAWVPVMGFAACAAALRAAGLFWAADDAFIPPAAQLLCGSLLAAAPSFLQPLLPSFSILLFPFTFSSASTNSR